MEMSNEMKEGPSSELTEKLCVACQKVLPSEQFGKDTRLRSGLRSWCRPCESSSAAQWQKNNRERARKTDRKRNKNPRRIAQARYNSRKRRAIKLSLPHVAYDANEIYEREAGICHLCGTEVDRDMFHVEHLIPIQVDLALLEAHGILSHPGDVPWNVSIAHPSCNSSKGNRMTQDDVAKYFQYLMLYGG